MDEEKATMRKRGKHTVGFSLALMCILYWTTLWNIHRAQQRYWTLNHYCFTKNVFSISLFKFTTIDDAAISKTERFQSWYFLVASLVSPINEIKWLTNWYKKQALQITKDLRDIKKYQTPVFWDWNSNYWIIEDVIIVDFLAKFSFLMLNEFNVQQTVDCFYVRGMEKESQSWWRRRGKGFLEIQTFWF